MLPTIQTRKRPQRHREPGPVGEVIPPDPPVPVTASVNRVSLRYFAWYFDLTYSTAGHDSWVPADFANLIIEGQHPVAIINTSGEDGTLVLEYEFDTIPPEPLAWEVNTPVPILVFGSGAGESIIPQSGLVNP